jgi:hypothetical protein
MGLFSTINSISTTIIVNSKKIASSLANLATYSWGLIPKSLTADTKQKTIELSSYLQDLDFLNKEAIAVLSATLNSGRAIDLKEKNCPLYRRNLLGSDRPVYQLPTRYKNGIRNTFPIEDHCFKELTTRILQYTLDKQDIPLMKQILVFSELNASKETVANAVYKIAKLGCNNLGLYTNHARINDQDKYGNTIMHGLIKGIVEGYHDNIELCMITLNGLRRNGAELLPDNTGRTPLDYAYGKAPTPVIERLKEFHRAQNNGQEYVNHDHRRLRETLAASERAREAAALGNERTPRTSFCQRLFGTKTTEVARTR